MIAVLPICLFGAGLGAYAAGQGRLKGLGHRTVGVTLMGAALVGAAAPARADAYRQAQDNAEVACIISSRELTRISLVGDAFASVSRITTGLPGQDFTVTSEPVRGDIYLSVPDGWNAPALSFFATSRKGYVYKFACQVADVPAEQLFVSNPTIVSAASRESASLSPSAAAIDLIRSMAAGAVPGDYTVREVNGSAKRVGSLEVRLVAEYRGNGLLGRRLRIANHGPDRAALDADALDTSGALAISLGAANLAPNGATDLYVVLPLEIAR